MVTEFGGIYPTADNLIRTFFLVIFAGIVTKYIYI